MLRLRQLARVLAEMLRTSATSAAVISSSSVTTSWTAGLRGIVTSEVAGPRFGPCAPRQWAEVHGTCREAPAGARRFTVRSEEHTSELQSRGHLVCRLLLAKKKHNAR